MCFGDALVAMGLNVADGFVAVRRDSTERLVSVPLRSAVHSEVIVELTEGTLVNSLLRHRLRRTWAKEEGAPGNLDNITEF